jgi:hypothetical protein
MAIILKLQILWFAIQEGNKILSIALFALSIALFVLSIALFALSTFLA